MKLRNKKTGETIDIICHKAGDFRKKIESLAQLNEEWEDYEEPKDYYFIRSESLTVGYSPISNTRSCRNRKQIGNYFETKEEAEKAVEKLKAWKRLKDKGAIFKDWFWDKQYGTCIILGTKETDYVDDENEEVCKDLGLLFGGEE